MGKRWKFLYKKLGRRRNVAPCKNCIQSFDVVSIICNFGLEVNSYIKFFRRIIYVLNYLCLHNDSHIIFLANS